MIKGNVFDMVCELTSKRFSSQNHSVIELLYGYAKLVSMNKGVLSIMFENAEDQSEIERISELFASLDIQLELLREGAPFLADTKDAGAANDLIKSKLDEIKASTLYYGAYDIAKMLMDMSIPQLEYCKKGKTLDDIFAYHDQNKAEKKAQDEPKEPEQAVQDTSTESSDPTPTPDSKSTAVATVDTANMSKADRFKKLADDTNRLYERLSSLVMGQNEAIRTFAQGYFQSEVLKDEENDKKGVNASFLFAGPPGVGKTYLSTCVSDILGIPYLRLDMTEYSTPSSVQTLTGVPKTYAGPKPGVLTDFVKRNPRCLVLVDEVEKAHTDVLHQFLQVLDAGSLTDSFSGESVQFRNAILIFTTNVGKSLYEDSTNPNLSSIPRSVVIKAITEEKDSFGEPMLPAPLCSRFASGNLLMFNHLDVHNLVKIATNKFDSYAEKIKSMYGYEVDIDKKLAPMLLFAQSTGMDARNISAQSVMLMKNEMYEFGRHIPASDDVLAKLKRISFIVDDSNDESIARLFSNDEETKIIIFGDQTDFVGVPFSDSCKIIFADSVDDMLIKLGEDNITFAVIDPLYAPIGEKSDYLSLDDMRTEGILAFRAVTEKLPQVPVYLLEKQEISFEDQSMFNERGARGFININDKIEFSNQIANISDMMYMQQKADELSSRGRVLSYNSAQRITENGEAAELIFYDFKTTIAADSSESKVLLSEGDRPKDKFADVIGSENAKSELRYFVNYLLNPKSFMINSVKPPKGILLYGPPGTGKTMLARAMAGESDVSFFPATGAGFQDKFVGEGEKKIRDLFKVAKKFAPSIIFIDEIDAIGKERTGSEQTHHTESLLNTLLTEMDGFEVDPARPVFVLAATNYDLDGAGIHARLDPALLRRFDNKIYVDLPNAAEREKFIRLQLEKVTNKTVTDNAIHNIAQRTTGQSCAILKNILDLAVRNCGKKGEALNDDYLLNAFEEFMYGEKKEWNEDYYKSVSIHESGHAYICSLSGEKPSFVTIVSRGNFGGYMQHESTENTPSYNKDDLLWLIRTSLAGRAAEIEFFGEDAGINTGVSSDLEHATKVALSMICRYGMDDDISYSMDPNVLLQSAVAEDIMAKVDELIDREMATVLKLVHEGRGKIQALSDFLIKNNQATEQDIAHAFE